MEINIKNMRFGRRIYPQFLLLSIVDDDDDDGNDNDN